MLIAISILTVLAIVWNIRKRDYSTAALWIVVPIIVWITDSKKFDFDVTDRQIAFFAIMAIVGYFGIWKWWLKPLLGQRKADVRLNKRIKQLQDLGFEIPNRILDPQLSDEELELLKSDETPTEEHIFLYYKMYCKKFELKTQEMWTTEKPMDYEKWEERAKTKTEIHKGKGRFGFMVAGGYQFIIPMTCDSMIGIPPNQTYHRYHDYKRMVEVDDQQLMESFENATETDDG